MSRFKRGRRFSIYAREHPTYILMRTQNGYAEMLTTAQVKNLQPPATGSKITYDGPGGVAGFGLRTTAAGAKSFVLNYRASGQERRSTIGSFPNWSVSAARAEARRLRVRIDQGEDPLADRVAEREAPTVNRLAERYIEEHLPKKRLGSARDDQAMQRGWILPAIGNKKVAAVRPADIEALHAKITKSGAPIRANRVVGLCSKMFSLAVKWEYRPDNPCRGAVDRNPETKRKRYLSAAEIARLTEALAKCSSQPAANTIRLLMLTGARRNEVCGARWNEFDLAAGTWLKPGSTTKQRTDHFVPLSAPALQLLTEIRAKAVRGEEFVFPGRDGTGYLNIRATWEGVRKAAGLEDVHLHDLRHSFASILVSSGASLPLIGALLGHSNAATTHRYAHLALDPLREATERAAAVITGGGKSGSGEVVPLDRRARR
jgi:integrase